MVFVLLFYVRTFSLDGMILYIKSMVSDRCKTAVKNELKKLNLHYSKIELGEVELNENIPNEKIIALSIALKKNGFEIISNKKNILIEKIKRIIIQMIQNDRYPTQVNFSDYLTTSMDYNYTYLANIFSEIEGITIEQFIIKHKIEKVKELLSLEEFNLTEIAYRLNYSSVAHLSYQFKKTTGLTPTDFKSLKLKRRISLEKL